MSKFHDFALATMRVAVGMLAGSIAVALLIGMAYLLQLPQLNISTAVTIVLFTALSANIGAALIATAVQRMFAQSSASQDEDQSYGKMFERYVGKFSWVVAAIASTYGASRILELVLN